MGISCLALGLLAMAPAGSRPDAPQARRPVDLKYTITSSRLDGPRTIAAGHVVLHVDNTAPQPHQVALWLLPPNRDRQQVIDSMRATGRPPQGLVPFGGIGPLRAGQKGSLLMRLAPGEYIVYCTLNGTDGDTWFKHGMVATLDVTGPPERDLPYETASSGIMMGDARISFGQTVQRGDRRVLVELLRRHSYVVRGRQSIQLEGGGGPGHALVLLKSKDPIDMARYGAWLEGRGTPPEIVSGVPAVSPGQRMYLRVDLSPGGYILFCPNRHQRAGGLRGYQTGEFTQFTVR